MMVRGRGVGQRLWRRARHEGEGGAWWRWGTGFGGQTDGEI